MTDLPLWAIKLIAGLAKYDDEHPKLFAQYAGSADYQAADCPCRLLCAVPNDVIAYARGFAAGQDHASSVGGTGTSSEEQA
ncbi:hypothetical protein [Roseateles sp.]|uniref:hypothetical protein n=1 Tax=Roseateles sp. TaxID=1971397 RepID=UPI002F41752E